MSKVELIDTHCHIHDNEFSERYGFSADRLVAEAKKAGVKKLICVGTDVVSSVQASEFCKNRQGCFFSVALHPHEAEGKTEDILANEIRELDKLLEKLNKDSKSKAVAVGECGLDYYYHTDIEVREKQKYLLMLHIELAKKYDLPMIFHIRDPKDQDREVLGEAFSDFFEIVDKHKNIRGVVHSFSAYSKELEEIVNRGFFVGLNGIMTFTKDKYQLKAAKEVSLKNLILETDAPFLTPVPFRGRMCKPEDVSLTAAFLAELRGESLEILANETTNNAQKLFGV